MTNFLGGCKKILGYLERGSQLSWVPNFPVVPISCDAGINEISTPSQSAYKYVREALNKRFSIRAKYTQGDCQEKIAR